MVITFLTMYNKNKILQYTWELQKYKSKYFTGINITRKPCLRTIKMSKK